MNICDIKNMGKKKYIVLLSKNDHNVKESFEYSFHNVISLEHSTSEEEIKILIDFINQRTELLIIYNFDDIYRKILPYIRKTIKVKCIYGINLAKMTDWNIRCVFNNIMEFYDRNIITEIGCLDSSTFKVLRNSNYNAKHVILDIEQKENRKNKVTNTIGLLGNDYDPNHNTYNLLSAVTMVDYDKVKMIRYMPATEHFIKFFNIREQHVNTLDEAMRNNFVNLYANFTDTRYDIILKSMDLGIPCLLGNTEIFDEYPELKKFLVLDSDDDIREIAQKISDIKNNIEAIRLQYKKFRLDYTKLSKDSIVKFIEG